MTQAPGALFERLLTIMTRLRDPGGCPWDREQTRASLKPFLLEEAYEVLEAIEGNAPSALEEELGDLLFQVVFHAQIARERGEFDMSGLLERVIGKMVTRHPHVFGDAVVTDAREALHQWERLKQAEAERAGRPRSAVDGVPRGLPSLLRAQRLQAKAARVHFDWPDARAALEKVREEVGEVAAALAEGTLEPVQEEVGDALFALVNVSRLAGVDAEEALHQASEKFQRRFRLVEADLRARGFAPGAASPAQLEDAWATVKAQERDHA